MKDKLEFNKILEILATFAKTYVGKKLINDLTPSFDVIEVANRQAQTSCAIDMINKYGKPPVGEFNDVSLHLKKLSSDSILSAKEILDLAHVLKMSREVSYFFEEVYQNVHSDFNILKPLFNNLYFNLELEKEIFLKIIDENTIDDKASNTLYSIRASQRSLEQNIKDKLNHFVRSAAYSKYLSSPIITIRDNRYVIPVKDEYRGQISGFVHGMSSSGSTVFIEPTSVFDMNNEINSLKIKENIERRKRNPHEYYTEYIRYVRDSKKVKGRIGSYKKEIDGAKSHL